MKKHWFRASAAMLCAVLMSAAPVRASASTPQLPAPGDTGVSKEQQEQIGTQAAGEVYQQMPVLPDSSPETQYVRQLGRRLVAVIPPESSWPYEFHVIPQKEINAFALPGGQIFVNAATIAAADNEAELAGVLAHEMSHVYMQHSIKQMKKAQLTQGIAGALSSVLGGVGGTIGQLGQLGVGMAGGMLTLRYSREDEAQADAVGAIIMYKAGYDPRQLAQYFQKLDNTAGGRSPQFLSDHPNPGNRVQSVDAEVRNWPSRQFQNDSRDFAGVRQHAEALKTYSADEISQGAKSGLWAQQNSAGGVIPPNVAESLAQSASNTAGPSPAAAATAPAQVPAPTPVSPSATGATGPRKLAYDTNVPGASPWTDTGIDVVTGDRVVVTANGKVQNAAAQASGPEGLTRGWTDLLRALPVNAAGDNALIGRIGDSAAAVPFLVGANKELTANSSGRLFLGINQAAGQSGSGSYHVSVKIVPAQPAAARAQVAELTFPPTLLAQVPRRVGDAQGNAGDLVNFIVIGPEERLKAAFQGAGWVQVDRTKSEAVLHAVLSSASKQSYVEMPMSELYLFGRPQDFGFAKAEPVQVVASRHHLRMWKAPFQFEGQPVWAGAATHDIGFEKDQRTGGVTHKIDAKVDTERDFVGQCFSSAGALTASTYLAPSDAVRSAHTATGGEIESDGRVLVMRLAPGQP